MRRSLAGPTNSKHNPVIPGSPQDTQKSLPAAKNTGAYRSKNVAAGPQSAHTEYNSTQDAGVKMPVSGGGGKDYFM